MSTLKGTQAQRRQALLMRLRTCARNGERCPTRGDLNGYDKGLLPVMAREGFFTLEIGGRNWRVIEIDGLRTREPPDWKPLYRISSAGKVAV